MWWTLPLALAADLPAAELARATHVAARLVPELVAEEPMPRCRTVHAVVASKVREATASSSLREGSLVHGPQRAIDADRATAWVEGDPGVGLGASLRLVLDGEGQLPAGLRVTPGYDKDLARWSKNHRVTQVLVRWLKPADGVDPVDAVAQGALVPASTEPLLVTMATVDGALPVRSSQTIELHGPWWHQNMEVTELVAVELVIVAVEGAGATYDDTALSGIEWLALGPRKSVTCDPGWCASRGEGVEGC